MARPLWFVNLLKKSHPARRPLARLTNMPVLGRLMDYALFDQDHMVCLPPDRLVPVNEPIARPEEMALPSQVVDHFIAQAGHHWIMNFCICREGGGCQDYPQDLGCLFLGEAVQGINPQLGRPVSKEEAHAHVRRAREAGLVHIIGRNKLDPLWLGVGPGEQLFTICNCCPCCCLWNLTPALSPQIARKIHRMQGVTVRVNELCMGCETCMDGVCFVDAIHLVDGAAEIGLECRGCGRCVTVCPNEAIELVVEDGHFAGLTAAVLREKTRFQTSP